jgi:uncharacterized protein (TIGR01777 family)
MKVVVSGSSGLVGSALVPRLTESGHQVVRLVRSEPAADGSEVRWDLEAREIHKAGLEGVDAAVHLAGESIAAGRWTAAKKARILNSRARGTSLLAETLAGLKPRPKVLVSASGVHYYGERGDEALTENSGSGSAFFLSNVCRQWESATEPAAGAGIRVVNLRFGVILSADGGALPSLLTPFRLGIGGKLGFGRQFMPWITVDDAVGAIMHALTMDTLGGPVNAVAPQAVTNHEFTKTLGRVLGRPTLLPMPAFAARLAFGQMADELLLASLRVEPEKLLASGYRFRFPELEGALRHLLGK